MATVNKALKKRAQAFAEKHELSYLRALKAVDEPLHQLRDLLNFREISRAGYFPGLRLAKAEDRRVSPYAELIGDEEHWKGYAKLIARKELSRFDFSSDFYIELGRRIELIDRTHSGDIWRYRELHRAGLLSEESPYLEPFFHHFSTEFTWGAESAFFRAFQTGIVGVSIASAADYEGSKSLIPVTEEELESLKRGENVEKIELPSPLLGSGAREPAAFYRLQEDRLMGLIGDLVDTFTKTERELVLPTVKGLVSQMKGTIRELVTALRASMSETQRVLGSRLESELDRLQSRINSYGLSESNRAIKAKIDVLNESATNGAPYRLNVPEVPEDTASRSVDGDSGLLGLLEFSAEELDEAREEIAAANERKRRRELIVQLADELGVITMADARDARGTIAQEVDRHHRDTPANHLLTAVIRGLRTDPLAQRREIGAEFISKLASVQSGPQEGNITELVHAIGLPSKEFRAWKDTRALDEGLVVFAHAGSEGGNEGLSGSGNTWDKPLNDLIEENYS